jgi:predicted nucleotidyltransferase component of viral defense system
MRPVVVRIVTPYYASLKSFRVPAYSPLELSAEKLRALLQQQDKWPRPRDLYDLWHILCERPERIVGPELRTLFERKCEVRRIQPDVSGLTAEAREEWNRGTRSTQLAPMRCCLAG